MSLVVRWKEIPTALEIRKVYREAVAILIRDGIRVRVSQKGQGADGTLKGYSTNPLVVEPGTLKDKRKPVRGWYAYHGGGYKQYRQELGLQAELFVFSNKGAAWRDWRFFPLTDSGVIEFGFASGANSEAADAAVENGRTDMFDVDDEQLDLAAQKLLDTLLEKIYG